MVELSVKLRHTIVRIMVLTLKSHQKSAQFWAQSDEVGGIADELVKSRGLKTPISWSK